MISAEQYKKAKERTIGYFNKCGIAITKEEEGRIEVADFGLNKHESVGLQILTYVNTQKVCAKELVLFPHQTCPEHRHITTDKGAGKEETFRCRAGLVYLYVEGQPTAKIQAKPFWDSEDEVSVFREIVLRPGGQYTLMPDTKHWFQAGPEGAVISEFSTTSTDDTDIFTDIRMVRAPEIEG